MKTQRTAAMMLVLIAMAAALAACGRRNAPGPPKGREAEYTYPRFYPAPATVLPADAEESGVAVEREPPREEEIRRLSPVPSPDSRSRTRTSGPFSR